VLLNNNSNFDQFGPFCDWLDDQKKKRVSIWITHSFQECLSRWIELGGKINMELIFNQCKIRSWHERDIESLQRYADNRKIWLNLRDIFPHPYSLEDARSWIELAAIEKPECSFAIAARQEAIGGIGLTFGKDVHSHTAELGYWLGEPFWGKGIMSGAVSSFVSYVFHTYPISRIFAEPFATNLASRQVLEKAGFSLEGIMQKNVIKDGIVHDQALYAMVQD
jgi:ribosomal-protein-alanine N-acetyltransferase